jgi:hypothetical protein
MEKSKRDQIDALAREAREDELRRPSERVERTPFGRIAGVCGLVILPSLEMIKASREGTLPTFFTIVGSVFIVIGVLLMMAIWDST